MINYVVNATGSTGNNVIIEKKVCVDIGVSYKSIEPFMDDIKLVLLSHIHSDHFKASTARRMALEKPLLRFGCGTWMAKPLVDAGVSKSQIDVLSPNMLYPYGIVNVIPVELHHDVPNFGYKLHFPKGKVFIATDTGHLGGISAKGYDLLMVEANYVDEELRARMDAKIAEGRYAYEQRVLRYHLSKQQADDFIYRNAGNNTEYVYLHCHVDREKKDEGQTDRL